MTRKSYSNICKQENNAGYKAARPGRLLFEQLFGSGGFLRSRLSEVLF